MAQDFLMMKVINKMAPIINSECQLDYLLKRALAPESMSWFRIAMGLSFNNEIYYQLSKGLLPPDVLEMISNQTVLPSTSCSALIAPSMYIKQIWDLDSDYKFYF